MDFDKLTYSKPESGSLNLKDTNAFPDEFASEESPDLGVLELKPEYAKQYPTVETEHLFIVSGGEKKERDYFEALRASDSRRLKIIFISKLNQGLTPLQMYQVVKEGIEEECFQDIEGKLFHYLSGDRIFMVTDVDHYRRELTTMLARQDQTFKWIISNPAFEIWLFYHYYADPSVLMEDWPADDKIRSQHLKTKLGKLRAHEGGLNASDALIKMPDATKNSESNYKEEFLGFPAEFSTQMHVVAHFILETMKDDFGLMMEARTRAANNFLRKSHTKL